MKYKIAGCAMVLVMLLLILVIALLDSDQGTVRVHQHLTARQPDQPCNCNGEMLCTHLPLVILDTGDEAIPGVPDHSSGQRKFTLTEDGQTMLRAQMQIVDHQDKNNHPNDTPTLESAIDIRVRGASSRYFDKKSYRIILRDENGNKEKQEILGMDAFDEWTLYGPFLDKTLLRNYMWYNIGGELMDYAPNVRFCEVMLNGEYRGVYLMVESIDSSEDARLKLSEPEKNSSQVSYVLRVDRGSSNPIKNLDTFCQYSYRNLQAVDIVYPSTKELTQERIDWIEQDFSDFEKSLYSYDYDTGKYRWQNSADMDSFALYFIINEFTCNYDAGYLSTYIYKDLRGKYKLCIWDFNNSCEQYEQVLGYDTFDLIYAQWFVMMLKDESFTDRIIELYRQLRQTWLSEEYLDQYIDETVAYLGPAIERNFQVWGYSFEEDMLEPTERNPRSYEEAVEMLKNFLHQRGTWLDEHIETLRQYSHQSKNKKFNH